MLRRFVPHVVLLASCLIALSQADPIVRQLRGDDAPTTKKDETKDAKKGDTNKKETKADADKPKSEAAKKENKAAKPKPAEKYLRVVRDAAGDPIAMETSIVTFRRKGDDSLVVELIGAVHVGEGKYYESLNNTFAGYEVVLYELVAPEGTKIPKGGRKEGSGHPVGALQQGLKNILSLEFQLERVDYTKENFVHADMSPEEFAKTMKDRGESFLQMFFRMMGASVAQQAGKKGSASDAEILVALFSADRAFRLKRVMAQQFEDFGGVMMALEGPKGSTIIGERNRKALEVLKKQIDGGKKKIAIFYGAGHMPDFEKRLAADFQLEPGEVKWIEAWNLREPENAPKPKKKEKSEKKADAPAAK